MTKKTFIQGLESLKAGLATAEAAPVEVFHVVLTDKIKVPEIKTTHCDSEEDLLAGIKEAAQQPPTVEEQLLIPNSPEYDQIEAREKLDEAVQAFQRVLGERSVVLQVKNKLPDPPADDPDFWQKSEKQAQAGREMMLSFEVRHGLSLRDMFEMQHEPVTELVKDIIDASEMAVGDFIPPEEREKSHSDIVDHAAKSSGRLSLILDAKDADAATVLIGNPGKLFFSGLSENQIGAINPGPDAKKIEMVLSPGVTEIPKHAVQMRLEKVISALKNWTVDDAGNFVSGTLPEGVFLAAQTSNILYNLARQRKCIPVPLMRPLDGNRVMIENSDTTEQFITQEIGGNIQRGQAPSLP